MGKILKIILKVFIFVFVFTVSFFVYGLRAKAELTNDESDCIYKKNVHIYDYNGKEKAGTITVKVKLVDNHTTVDRAELSDTFKNYGFGFNAEWEIDKALSNKAAPFPRTKGVNLIGDYGNTGCGDVIKSDGGELRREYTFTYEKFLNANTSAGGSGNLCPSNMLIVGMVDNAPGCQIKRWMGWVTDDKQEAVDMYNDFYDHMDFALGLSDWGRMNDDDFRKLKLEWNNPIRKYYFPPDKPKDIHIMIEILNKVKPMPEMKREEAEAANTAMGNYADELEQMFKSYKKGEDATNVKSKFYGGQILIDDYDVKGFQTAVKDYFSATDKDKKDFLDKGYNKLIRLTNNDLFNTVVLKGDYTYYKSLESDLRSLDKEWDDNKCNENRSNDTCRKLKNGDPDQEKDSLRYLGITGMQDKIITEANTRGWSYNVIDWIFEDLGLPSGRSLQCRDFCDEMTGAKSSILNEIFGIFKIAAPILVIVLGSIDFAKAVLSEDADALKKAGKDFGKRLAAAIILFLLPTFVSFLLRIAEESSIIDNAPPICVDKPITDVCK